MIIKISKCKTLTLRGGKTKKMIRRRKGYIGLMSRS